MGSLRMEQLAPLLTDGVPGRIRPGKRGKRPRESGKKASGDSCTEAQNDGDTEAQNDGGTKRRHEAEKIKGTAMCDKESEAARRGRRAEGGVLHGQGRR